MNVGHRERQFGRLDHQRLHLHHVSSRLLVLDSQNPVLHCYFRFSSSDKIRSYVSTACTVSNFPFTETKTTKAMCRNEAELVTKAPLASRSQGVIKATLEYNMSGSHKSPMGALATTYSVASLRFQEARLNHSAVYSSIDFDPVCALEV